MNLEEIRDANGKLPAYAWPGGYQMIYITSDGAVLCPDCANGENGSRARTKDGTDDAPHDGWRIDGYAEFLEGPNEPCAHCGKEIESAYGDPDEEDRP